MARSMLSRPARAVLPRLAAALCAAFAAPAFAAKDLNMPVGVTELSETIYGLHMLIFWICVGIAVVVFGAMLYSIFRFRKSRGAVPDTGFTHSTWMEITWTIIPTAILVVMAVPAARALIKIEDTRDTELSIKVTGYQWRWHYDYLENEVNYFSVIDEASNAARQLNSGVDVNTVEHYLLNVDRPLVIPAGRKVRLLITSNDVIHAWWVPDFGMKRDAVPGFVNELWIRVDPARTGLYRGQCAELCGRDHGFMPIVVEVKSPEDFDAWLAEQQAQQPAPAVASTAQAQ